MTIDQIEEIDEMKADWEQSRACYLKSKGWEPTCKVPANIWLWEKEIDGKTLLVDESTAWLICEREALDEFRKGGEAIQ